MAGAAAAATLTISEDTTWTDGTPATGYDAVYIADGVTLTFESAAGVTNTYAGPALTGPGAVRKTGDGGLVFSGDNTFDGDLTIAAGTFQANSAGAFGSAVGKTICKRTEKTGPLLIFGATMTTAEPFDLRSTNNTGSNPWFAAGTTVTLNGSLALNSSLSNWKLPADTTIVINGNVSAGGTWGTGASITTSKIYWNGDFDQKNVWYFSGGCHYLKGHFTTSGNAAFNTRNGNYHFVGEKVFNGTQIVHQEDGNTLRYYLEGYDQACDKMGFSTGDSHKADASWDTFEINSTNGNIWTVMNGPSVMGAKFTGNVGLTCRNGTHYILKENTSTGQLTVTNGATVIMQNALTEPYAANKKHGVWAGDVTVEANSSLELNKSDNVSATAKIRVRGENARLTLNADIVLGGTGELWLGDAKAAAGTWGSADSEAENTSAYLSGTGTITVPVQPLEITADMLVDGVYTVATPTECSALTVSAPATIRGARLTVLGLGSVNVNANTTFEAPLALGTAAGDTMTIAVAGGVEARFDGVLSGPADITTTGAGTIYCSGANVFTGTLTLTAGAFHATSDGAFGATDGKTICDTSVAGTPELFFDGITTAEPLRIGCGNSKVHFVGVNTLNGAVEITKAANGQQYWNFQKGSKTTFNGALTAIDSSVVFMGLAANESPWAEMSFNGGISLTLAWFFQRGIHHYGGTITAQKVNMRGFMTAYLEGEKFSTCPIAQEDQAGEVNFVLNTCDVSLPSIARGNAANGGEATRGNKMLSFTSSCGKTLRVTGANATDSLFYGVFTGSVGASFEGSGSAVVLGGANTSTGTLTAKNGHTVRFAPSATYTGLSDVGSWAGDISVEAGSTVELNSAGNITPTTKIRVTGENATLALNADVALGSTGELWLGGEQATAGTWGAVGSGAAHESAYLSGTGTITVPALPLEITADMLVDGVYTVSTPTECSALRVSAEATIRGAALTVTGVDGITVSSNTTISCLLVLGRAAGLQMQLAVATNAELRVTGVISGVADVVTSGEGTIYLSGSNTFDGNLTVGDKTTLYADSDAAFGSTAGWTKCDTDTGARLHLRGADQQGITTAENFFLHDDRKGRIYFEGLTNTLSGSITLTGKGYNYWQFPKATTTYFNCPVTNAPDATVGFWGNAKLAEETSIPPYAQIHWNGPLVCSDFFYFEFGDHYVDGNKGGTLKGVTKFNPRNGHYYYTGPNVLGSGTYLIAESPATMTHTISGCDQTIGYFTHKNEAGQAAYPLYIESTDGRTLNVVQTVPDQTDLAIACGNLSLKFIGSKNVDILRANTSVGLLSIVDGATAKFSSTKKFSAVDFTGVTGSWAGDVTVGSDSKLTLAANAFTGKRATLALTGNGVIDIPAGLTVRVGYLTIDGKIMTYGNYGATVDGLDADVKAHFTGEGVLRVAYGHRGLIIRVH